MSRAGSSSKFVSVNLNKSYGQPSLSGAAGFSSSPLSSASGLNRSRLPNSHGGMVFLSRPSRPQPASSTSSAPFKGSKLAVPRPVNLPSLRKEHAGNDPAVPLVGVSASSGWTKQQVLVHPVDNSAGQPGSSVVHPAVRQVRSVALTTESTWGDPVTQGRRVASHDAANHSLEGPPPSYQQAPIARPLLYTPPGARSARGNVNLVPAHLTPPPVEKTVLLRGEDFPTLQAALPSPAAPPQQRQRDLHQKQREKQNELKEQQKKLQQLSQQPLGHKTAEDVALTRPQLQPAQPVRPQAKSKQSSNHSQEDGRSLDHHGTFLERANRRSGKVGGTSYGPLQSTRWSHTSNWVDDERETLQTLRAEGISQSDWVEPGRPRNGYHFTDDWARDHGPNAGFGRQISRNGSLSGLGRNVEYSRDHFPVRNGGLSFEGAHGKVGGFRNGYTNKEIYSDRLVLKPKDDIDKVDGDFGRNDFLKQVPVSAVKDSKDGRFGNSSRPSGLNRDTFMYRDDGYERERNGSIFRDAGNVRDVIYRRDTFRRDTIRQDGYPRDVGLRQESGFGEDKFVSKRGASGNNVDGSHGWQGDRVGRNNNYQFDGNVAYSHADSSARDRQEMFGLDFGRDRRPKFLYGQLQGQYPSLGDHMDLRATSVFDLEPCAGISGLEVKALRRKKDDSKDDSFRDLARESFEAELERVQKMQEQERQKTIDEQKKVIELAIKEQEERERLARAEEELRLKLEEEAREAAARAQIEAEEAVRRAEEEHKAREEERERIVLEEERRKDAARRKLLELEERIAKREFEKRQEAFQKEDGAYLVRPQNDEIMCSQDDARKVEELDWEDQDRFLPSFSKAEQDDDERAPFSADWSSNLPLAGREVVEGPSSRSRLVDPALWSTDMKGRHAATERTKTVQTWSGEIRDNGDGLPLAPAKPHLRDGFLPHRQHEQHQRGPSNRELSHEATRTHFSGKKLGRVRSELSARSGQGSIGQDQRWTSNEDKGFSVGYSFVDADSGFVDTAIARDADRWWGRDDHRRSQGQCLMSPPLPSYLHSAGTSDYPSFGRLRQSLPKQPWVPPPPPGRATIPMQNLKSDNAGFVPSVLGDGDSGITPKAREDCSERVDLEVHEFEDEYKEDELSNDVQVAKHQESATPEEVSVQSDLNGQVSVECAKGSTICQAQIYHEDLHERVLSDPLSEKVDSGISIPPLSRERPEEYEVDVTIDSQSGMAEEPIDDNDGWVAQQGEDGLDEESSVDDCVEVHKEGTHLEVEDPESGSPSKSIEELESDGEPASKYLAEDFEDLNMEEQKQEGRHDKDVTGKLNKPFDSELEDSPESIQEVGQGAEDLKGPDLQKMVREPVAQPILLQPSYMPASLMESVQFQQPEGLSSRQSFVQQFQQPFSFMAVPLPQSNSSNTVAPHPAMLTSVPGLQNHQEVPFHLRLGLLSGTPLIPNAIQIGSIQMPLHMHPQVPQLAHLHGLQPPMFQFGQLGHSAPLTQPLHIVQPDVQAHNAVGQPSLSEHHQLKADEPLSRVDTLDGLPKSDQVFSAGDELLAQKAGFMWIEHKSALDRPYHREHANSRSSVSSECSFEQKDQFPPVFPQEKNHNMQASPSKECNSEGTHSMFISPETVVDIQNIQADQSSVLWPSEMILGGGRNNSSQSNGVLGQGQLRFHARKSDDLEPLHSATEVSLSEMRAEGGIHNRMSCRNSFGSQYKVSDSFSSFDNESAVTTNQGRHQPCQEMSRGSGLEVSSGLASGEGGTNRDGLRESGTHMYNRALGKETGQTLKLRTLQGGSKGDRSYSKKVPLKNGLTNNLHLDEVPKKYKVQSAGDAPLQTGAVCVLKQPGIEIPNDEDDFIEVRSKRQMLREQREQREKDSKAKSKEIKEKEQAVRKQQRLSAKAGQHNEAAGTISSKNDMERQTGLSTGWSTEVASNEIRLSMHSLSAGTGITSPQTSVTPTSVQVLPPIGTLASVSLDGTVEKMSKASKPGQVNSTLGAGFARGNHNDCPDSVSNTTTAWGGQWSSQKVVSLTQIQLEEAMKPIRFEGPLLQKVPMSDVMSMALEPEIAVAPTLVHEIAPALARAPGSVSGPISSLLAGEKIQFGAVTSPTLISPSSHSLSPALVGVDSSLGSGSDASHNYTHAGNARHYSGSGRDVAFTSKGKHTRGDDGIHRQVVDPEAEAEAAASAVAVAAISSDESGGNAHCLDARNAVLRDPAVAVSESSFEIIDDFAGSAGIPVTRPVMMQTLIKAPGIEDSMAVALPADLSVETRSPLVQGPLSNGPASSGLMLQSFPSGAPPFPCLEMGTMLGSPIFTFAPHEDASSFQHVSRPGVSLEPALAAVGASGVGGWQQRHAGTADSFYGATPSGFTGPFISPTGGISNIQGPPHMLVYTNPFAPVGQFGQLGVSFMGTTYLPSGKQPDWKHTPLTTSCSGASGVGDGLSGTIMSLRSTTASNSAQQISPAGSSVIPVAAPLSLFDANVSAPFQIPNADVSVQSQWSEVSAQHLHMPIPGQLLGLSLQPQHSSHLPNQFGHFPHFMDVSNGFHQLPMPTPVVSSSSSTVDAAQFPDELGVGDCASSSTFLINGGQPSSGGGYANNSAVPGTTGSAGIKSQRGRRPSRISRGGSNGATCSSGENFILASTSQGTDGSQIASPQLLTQNLRQPGSLGQHPHSLGFADQRGSQQGLARASLGSELSGGHHRKGGPGRIVIADRGSVGERGFVLPSKLKQVYVAKPAITSSNGGAATADTISNIFSGQEVA